uniref:Aromatic amino acid beta-eliminating lyase/threonine aldolase domain-containing protein n=2 Tax=Chrysotila carterae TaxID=13221 RepID=A0A7S4C3H1_CHRCT
MLKAMISAPVGDDVFGEDPTVKALEDEVSALLDKEASVFVPSGTMSNQLALRLHAGPLQEVLVDHRAHVHVWEVGGIHALCGASVAAAEPLPPADFLCADAVRAFTRVDNALYHQPVTTLLCLENTLNGDVMSLEQVQDTTAAARTLGLDTHLDGARLWNACTATGHAPADFSCHFDTVSVCLSKGLGAPIGSVLSGSSKHIDRARHFRKLYGGGWRQAGILAAAGLHALREHRSRLNEDHENAIQLADGLAQLGFSVKPPQTNMVWCAPPADLLEPFETVAQRLRDEERIFIGSAYAGPGRRNPFGDTSRSLRFVTHMQTPKRAVTALLAGLAKQLPSLRVRPL